MIEEIEKSPRIQPTTSQVENVGTVSLSNAPEVVKTVPQSWPASEKALLGASKVDSVGKVSRSSTDGPCAPEVVELLHQSRPASEQAHLSANKGDGVGKVSRSSADSSCASEVVESLPGPWPVSKEECPAGTKMDISEVVHEKKGGDFGTEIAEPVRRLRLPPVPTSSIQFQTDWKHLKRDRNMLTQYFKVYM